VWDIGTQRYCTILLASTDKPPDGFNKLTEKLFGYSTYGYWPWHDSEEAVKDCDEHVCPATCAGFVHG